jgi:ribose transport system substrate-binding protein
MKRKALFTAFTLVAAASLLVTGCRGAATPTPVQCEKDAYLVTAPLVEPALTVLQGGAQDAAEELGVDFFWLSPAQYDQQKQIEITESALSNPCIVGLAPLAFEPGYMEAVLARAKERGLAVAQVGSCPEMEAADICWGTDFYNAGAAVAERLGELMGGQGSVVVAFGQPGNNPDKLRQQGLEDYFAAHYPNIRVIGVVTDCDNPEGSVACAENALATYPEMNAYYSCGWQQAIGPSTVFPQAGRDDIIITAVDDDPLVLEAIREGTIAFTYAQSLYAIGYMQVYIPWLMHTKGLKPTARFLDTRIVIVDQSNIDTYKDDMMQLLTELKEYVATQLMVE